MYYVYFLKSLSREKHYIGVSQDLKKRLEEHNSGSTKSTKPYRPWTIIYKEEFLDKHQAYKREFFLKSPKGYLEKKKIVENNKLPGGVA